MKGIIFDIKRMALHDGPGIRQTVFMKGCPLQCRWCHNPESRSTGICHYTVSEPLQQVDIEYTETLGREVGVEEVMTDLLRDRLIYEESGGGVTFSGGEPLMQPAFLKKVLKACQSEDLHTTIDTTGYAVWKTVEDMLPHTDLLLYDLKHPDDDQHKRWTGVSNMLIVDNLFRLDALHFPLWIRIPVVPGVNNDYQSWQDMVALLKRLQHPVPVFLLPYHRTGMHKYSRYQINPQPIPFDEPEADDLSSASDLLREAGFEVRIGG